jgi:hypothetical protein
MSQSNNIGFDSTAVYRETGLIDRPPFALGTRMPGRNGRDFIFAKATGAVASAAAVILTEPAMTVATGAGSWTNRTGKAIAINESAWFEKNSI